jgi:NADH dehydrogenase (ubiquinone) 1 alpha subcomplex subunit 8
MLCKSENRDPEHCLKEGRKVTRCAAELYVFRRILRGFKLTCSITKMRESCLSEFDAHWKCLEQNNQVSQYIWAGCRNQD